MKQEKQRVKDLESDIELLQRQLRLAQMKLSEQNSSQIFDRFFEKCSTFEIDSNEKTSKIFDEFENLQKIIRFVRDQNASFSRVSSSRFEFSMHRFVRLFFSFRTFDFLAKN